MEPFDIEEDTNKIDFMINKDGENEDSTKEYHDQDVWYAALGELVGMIFFCLVIEYSREYITLLFGFYAIMMFFIEISGSNFNPNISLGLFILLDHQVMSLKRLIIYVVAQFIGMAIGWLIAYNVDNDRIVAPVISEKATVQEAIWLEFFWGGFLVAIALYVSSPITRPSTSKCYNVALFVIVLYSIIAQSGVVSGASFNPAIGLIGNLLAILFVKDNDLYKKSILVVTFANLAGCIFFSLVFKYGFIPLVLKLRSLRKNSHIISRHSLI